MFDAYWTDSLEAEHAADDDVGYWTDYLVVVHRGGRRIQPCFPQRSASFGAGLGFCRTKVFGFLFSFLRTFAIIYE
ncbi:MAG: hypothetical protein C6P35_15305 [Cohnella sp.]|nr:MAG: hypothetical protein C6P35_15305 [Cohnella sp.]